MFLNDKSAFHINDTATSFSTPLILTQRKNHMTKPSVICDNHFSWPEVQCTLAIQLYLTKIKDHTSLSEGENSLNLFLEKNYTYLVWKTTFHLEIGVRSMNLYVEFSERWQFHRQIYYLGIFFKSQIKQWMTQSGIWTPSLRTSLWILLQPPIFIHKFPI